MKVRDTLLLEEEIHEKLFIENIWKIKARPTSKYILHQSLQISDSAVKYNHVCLVYNIVENYF